MKKILLATMVASTLGLTACNCNKSVEKPAKKVEDTTTAVEATTVEATTTIAGATSAAATTAAATLAVGNFGWDGIKKSVANLGSFPYFNLPEGFKLKSTDGTNPFSKIIDDANNGFNFFDGKAISTLKGKLGFLDIESDGDKFDQEAFNNHVTAQMEEIGAIEITSENPSKEVLAQISELDGVSAKDYLNCEHEGVNLRQFVVNHEDGQLVYQVASDHNHGQVGILEVEGFKAHEGHGEEQPSANPSEPEAAIAPIANEPEELPVVEPVVEEAETAEEMQSQLSDNGKVTVKINFDSGKSDIRSNNMGDVETIYKLLTDNADLKLSIEGHTDSSGNADSNKKLSQARADAVMAALVSKGIAADRLKAVGYGEEKPVTSNDTAESREINRRVELVKF